MIADIIWDSLAGWKQNAYQGIMGSGKTLVDLVSSVFTGLEAAATAIKEGVAVMVNAIGSAYSFVTDLILSVIMGGFSLLINTLLLMIGAISSMIPGQTYDFSDNIHQFSDIEIGISSSSSGLHINLFDFSFILNPLNGFETLGSGENTGAISSSGMTAVMGFLWGDCFLYNSCFPLYSDMEFISQILSLDILKSFLWNLYLV